MSETKKYIFQRHWEIIKVLAQTLLTTFVLLNTAYGSSQSNWVENDFAKFRIISGVESIGNLDEIPLGLEFELIDGWKVYWRNPGDAGFPPSFIENGRVGVEKNAHFTKTPSKKLQLFSFSLFFLPF